MDAEFAHGFSAGYSWERHLWATVRLWALNVVRAIR